MKKLAIYSRDDESWVGGLYYKRNITYMLLNNPNIVSHYKICVLCFKKNDSFFREVDNNIEIHYLHKHKSKYLDFIDDLFVCFFNNIKLLYAYNRDFKRFHISFISNIAWIPDFQHIHYPEFFSKEDIELRNREYSIISNNNVPLVLSSNTCKTDFINFYKGKNAIVMPFVSYIIPELRLQQKSDESVLKHYDLNNKKYIIICNQFWKHKNHIVALKAFDEFIEKNHIDNVILVLTGKVSDYRNPDYINEINNIISKYSSGRRLIRSLGFVPRIDQLILIKNSAFVIQPSLSEGWGTTVEDSKVFDKTMLLSDIPVHHEQMNEKCTLFDPYDADKLADLIADECNKEHHDDINRGIENMKKNALLYTKEFEEYLLSQV